MIILHRSILVVLLFTFLTKANASTQTDLAYWVKEAFDAVKTQTNYQDIKLRFDTKSKTSTDNNGVIIINIIELQLIVDKAIPGSERDVVQLIVGHEFAHAIQRKIRSQNANSQSVVQECQADILAGAFYPMIKFRVATKNIKNHRITSENSQRILDALSNVWNVMEHSCDLMFKLGDDYTLRNTHPRREERLAAVRNGFYYGSSTIFNDFLRMDTNSAHKRLFNDIRTVMNPLLDILPTENYFEWSLRTARSIVHTPSSTSKDICVYNTFYLEKCPVNCNEFIYHYQHTIKNIGEAPLNLLFYDQTFTTKKQYNVKNTLYWRNVKTHKKEISLMPGEAKRVNGQIKCVIDKNQPENVPLLVMFGDPASMYHCTKSSVLDTKNRDIDYAIWDEVHPPSLINALDVILSNRRWLFEFILGVGNCPQSDLRMIYYRSKISLPTAMQTQIVRDDVSKTYKLEAKLFDQYDEGECWKSINRFCEALKATKFGLSITKEVRHKNYTYLKIFNANGELVGQILFQKKAQPYSCSATLRIFGV